MALLKQSHKVEVSGYVRGYKKKVIWYDSETKEIVDSETFGDIEIVRDDTESGDNSYPSFDDNLPFEIEEE